MRKVFLDDLPKLSNRIIWANVKGYIVRFIYEEIEDFLEIINVEKVDNRILLTIKYKDNTDKIYYNNFSKCKIGKLLKKVTSDFKIEIGQTFKDDKRDITIIDRKMIKEEQIDNRGRKCIANKKYYKYKCNKCGFDCGGHYSIKDKQYREELWIEESPLLSQQQGCSCCCFSPKIVVEDINSIIAISPWMIPYINDIEFCKTHTPSCREKVQVKCPDCGKNKNIILYSMYTNHSMGCTCGDGYSYGHKYIFSLLTQLNQEFIDNYTTDWCKFYNTYKRKEVTGEYDFVIENKKLIIEVDGGFHRKDNTKSGQSKEESKFLDNEKDRLALKHGIEVIRIIYNDDNFNIKQNILNNKGLNRIFDLSKIDWNKCEEFALSNLIKIACEYKKNNPDLTTTQIGEIMNLHSGTICKYLKKGTKLDWCYYNTQNEMIKNIERNRAEAYFKPLKMFNKKMELIYMFYNGSEAIKESKKLLHIILNQGCISEVCLGHRKYHKNYIFQKATKEEYNKWLEQQNKLKEPYSQELRQAM